MPETPEAALPLTAEVIAAALEWVDAHDAVSAPSASSGFDSELLERYSEACTELLAVVSQNRDALCAEAAHGAGLDVERLAEAIGRDEEERTSLRQTTRWYIGRARGIAREYAALASHSPATDPAGWCGCGNDGWHVENADCSLDRAEPGSRYERDGAMVRVAPSWLYDSPAPEEHA